MKRDDKRPFRASLMESLQARKFCEAGRRPRLPEVQKHVPSAETMKSELIAEIVLEYRVGRGIARRKDQPQRTKLWRPRRHGVLSKDGRQCRSIRFAFVFPDELASGIDEKRRGRLDDAKRACPAPPQHPR